MNRKKFGVVFSSILLLPLASISAWANDRTVTTVTITSRESTPIGPDRVIATWSSNASSARCQVFEGAKWSAGAAITWSISENPGTADSPFSGYLDSQYDGIVGQAFQTWAAASGLTFVKIPDSPQSDIRLGWGIFNTSSTGIVGHTMGLAMSGQMLPGAIVRLEDPAQDPFVAGAGNILIYSGTKANFYQVVLHEIGHALGLGDNDDPESIMNFEATGANNSLTSSDVAGIRTLYGSRTMPALELGARASTLSGSAMISLSQPMNQARASFQANQTAVGSSQSPSVVNPPFIPAEPLH